MLRIFSVFLLISVFGISCHNPPVPPKLTVDTSNDSKTITVTGIAKLDVPPDLAQIHLTFSSTKRKIKQAHNIVQQQVQMFNNSLQSLGIKSEQLKSGHTSYNPDYYYPDNGPRKISTFTASVSMFVELKNFELIPEVIDAAIEQDVFQLNNIKFSSTKLPEFKKQVRDMAIKAAKDKAEQIVQGFDSTLGKLIHTTETAYDASTGSRYGLENVVQNYSSIGNDSASIESDSHALTVTPDSIPLQLNLTASFEIVN